MVILGCLTGSSRVIYERALFLSNNFENSTPALPWSKLHG